MATKLIETILHSWQLGQKQDKTPQEPGASALLPLFTHWFPPCASPRRPEAQTRVSHPVCASVDAFTLCRASNCPGRTPPLCLLPHIIPQKLQHIHSLLDLAHLNPKQAGTVQCYKCWVKVTSQWLPVVPLVGLSWGVCNQRLHIWIYHSPPCAFRQWWYLFIQASLLCPEAGEGTVKLKGSGKILGSVSRPWGSYGNYCCAATMQALLPGRQTTCLFPYW